MEQHILSKKEEINRAELRGGLKMIYAFTELGFFLFLLPYVLYKADHPKIYKVKTVYETQQVICIQDNDNHTWCFDTTYKDTWDKR